MIEERFIKRAVEIRRDYVKITRDISVYESKAKQVLETLESTVAKLNSIQDKIKKKIITNADDASKKIMDVLSEVEKEGERLEKMIDPLNDQIEKLRVEENELYRLIKEKYPKISDQDIVKQIQEEIKKANLS
jgi:Holliday junction resolvasome RuvABC ATP-dependent DNA helicase subunit